MDLTIGTMADENILRIDIGFISDLAAKTRTINFHFLHPQNAYSFDAQTVSVASHPLNGNQENVTKPDVLV